MLGQQHPPGKVRLPGARIASSCEGLRLSAFVELVLAGAGYGRAPFWAIRRSASNHTEVNGLRSVRRFPASWFSASRRARRRATS